MSKRSRRRVLRLRGFDEPASVARIGVGLMRQGRGGLVGEEQVERAIDLVRSSTKGATAYRAEGHYTHDDGTAVREPSLVFEVVDMGSCRKFKKTMKSVARQIARELDQETVLLGVQCPGGKFDVTFERGSNMEPEPEDD
jgi:hypothetical protein